jgi:hypothetical protein
MKKILFLFLCWVSLLTQAQDLTIASGTTKTLTAVERTLTLHKLVLGDNCTIIIPATLDGWTVTADDAQIGTNVKILGSGISGINGVKGTDGVNTTTSCQLGIQGANGVKGGIGTNGKNVLLHLRLRSLGSLQINVNGGNGGKGGNGGFGGKGGPSKCSTTANLNGGCDGGTGGKGGNGGIGGTGGNGGNIKIEYKAIGNTTININNIIVTNNGGVAGLGGSPGAGGLGGQGTTCGALFHSRINGSAGLSGLSGTTGTNGTKGGNQVTIF